MRKLAGLVVLLLLCGAWAAAQPEPPLEPEPRLEEPSSELFGGYDHEHADLSGSTGPTLGAVTKGTTALSGFAIEFSHYFFPLLSGHLGAMVEVSRVSNDAVDDTGIGYVRTRFMAGPTYRFHKTGFFVPSLHVLGGVDRATFTVPFGFTKISFRDTELAVVGGGSVDGILSRHLAVRLAQLDFVYTRHYDSNQTSFRYIGGIVLRF